MTNDLATITAAAATVEERLARKRCPSCRLTLPRSEFRPAPSRPDGLSSTCRPCHRESMAKYRSTEAGRAAQKAANRKHYAKQKASRQATAHAIP